MAENTKIEMMMMMALQSQMEVCSLLGKSYAGYQYLCQNTGKVMKECRKKKLLLIGKIEECFLKMTFVWDF